MNFPFQIFLIALAGCLFAGSAAEAKLPTYGKPTENEMRAHYINVGQGSAVLLEFSCGAALIDTGGEKNDDFDSVEALQTYLDGFFARRTDLRKTLDLLLITHAHIDHTRGMPLVLSHYKVLHLVDNGMETGSGGRQQKAAHAKFGGTPGENGWQAIAVSKLTSSAGLPINPISCSSGTSPKMRALWGGTDDDRGWSRKVLDNQNDSSVVTRLEFGKASFLFLGDLEQDVQPEVIGFLCPTKASAARCMLHADVFHVAHHGADNGTSPELLSKVTPQIAVMSMGPPSRTQQWTAVAYGHPRESTVMQLLSKDGVRGTQRATKSITAMVATRGASQKLSSDGQFKPIKISKDLYATGWDGTVVITANSDGIYRIDTDGAPK